MLNFILSEALPFSIRYILLTTLMLPLESRNISWSLYNQSTPIMGMDLLLMKDGRGISTGTGKCLTEFQSSNSTLTRKNMNVHQIETGINIKSQVKKSYICKPLANSSTRVRFCRRKINKNQVHHTHYELKMNPSNLTNFAPKLRM